MNKSLIKIGQLEINFLLESSQTSGQITMFEFSVPVGAKVPLPHYHENFDETIYGIEGVMTFTIDGKTIDIQSGQTLFFPRGATHGFNNHGEINAKALAIVNPGLIGPEYFIDLAEIVNAGGSPDVDKIKAVFKKYGLVPIVN
jgi:quercetin dioxygenase-like cupin family protein